MADERTLEQRIKDLERMASRRPGSPDDEWDDPPRGRRDVEIRIGQLTGRAKQLSAELEEAHGVIAELRQARTADRASWQEQTARTVAELQAQHAEQIATADLGIKTPTGRAALAAWHQSQPEASRAKTPSEMWRAHLEQVQTARADKKDEPQTPAELAAYLPKPEEPPDAGKPPPRNPAQGASQASGSREAELERRVNAAKNSAELHAAYRWYDSDRT